MSSVFKLQMTVPEGLQSESTLDGCEESLFFNYMQIYWESGLGKSKGDGVGDTLKVQLDKSVYIDNKFHHNQKELFDYYKVEL